MKRKDSALHPLPPQTPPSSRRTPLQDRSRRRVEQHPRRRRAGLRRAGIRRGDDRGDRAPRGDVDRLRLSVLPEQARHLQRDRAPLRRAVPGALRHVHDARGDPRAVGTSSSTTPSTPSPRSTETEPGFRAILVNWRVSADMVLANDEVNREFARRAEVVLSRAGSEPHAGAPHARRDDHHRGGLGDAAPLRPPAERRFGQILAEAKTLLFRYLEPIVTENARAPAKKGGAGAARARGTKSPRTQPKARPR